MTRFWRRFAGRIDGMSLRERIMILLAAAAVTYSVFDAVVVSPVLGRQRYVDQELRQRQADVGAMSEQLRLVAQSRAQDPDAANRRKLQEANERLALIEQELKDQARVLIAPERMRGVLERVLVSRPGLQLVELKSLPQASIGLSAGAARKPAAGASTGPEPGPRAHLYKHGFELTLRGGYFELLDYLRGLEALPDRLYWDKLQLSVGKHPVATMTLTIYTVSMDKGWLQV